MAWVRSYPQLRQHPKVRRFADALGISMPEAIGYLHFLWWAALPMGGDVSHLTLGEIGALAMWEGNGGDFVEALYRARIMLNGMLVSDAFFPDRLYHRDSRGPMRKAFEAMRSRLAPVVFERDEWRCRQCGSLDSLEVDHVVAIARGGTNDLTNLQALCRDCNRAKGDR